MTTVVRVSEAAGAEWGEFDAKRALWTIPEARMKGSAPHIVPLSDAAREILATCRADAYALGLSPVATGATA